MTPNQIIIFLGTNMFKYFLGTFVWTATKLERRLCHSPELPTPRKKSQTETIPRNVFFFDLPKEG